MLRRLGDYHNQRVSVTATLTRYGMRPAGLRRLPTALLSDIATDDGQPLAAHVWLRDVRPLRQPGIRPGVRLRLTATVISYTNRHGATNYSLAAVNNVRLIH